MLFNSRKNTSTKNRAVAILSAHAEDKDLDALFLSLASGRNGLKKSDVLFPPDKRRPQRSTP